jgi:hypothetical protein
VRHLGLCYINTIVTSVTDLGDEHITVEVCVFVHIFRTTITTSWIETLSCPVPHILFWRTEFKKSVDCRPDVWLFFDNIELVLGLLVLPRLDRAALVEVVDLFKQKLTNALMELPHLGWNQQR